MVIETANLVKEYADRRVVNNVASVWSRAALLVCSALTAPVKLLPFI